tara:strand:+ start:560 stop:871 length:312 start_codon:yes stop_codon:yes gene_type:complete
MISVLVLDRAVYVDGIVAFANDDRISTLIAPIASDVSAIQFSEEKNIGHVEFINEYGDPNPKGNLHITASDIDIASIKSLHSTLIAEEEERLRIKEEEKANVV